jgi:hypothetical protein
MSHGEDTTVHRHERTLPVLPRRQKRMPVATFSLRTWVSRSYRRGDAFTGRESGFSSRAAGGAGAARAAHASYPLAVFLAEVGDASCAGFEDPQAEQAQKRD